MGLLKGIANIVAKGKRPVSLKTKVITATTGITIVVISAGFLGGVIKETRQSHAQKLQTDIYTSLGLDEDGDLSELIEIKGNEYTGYYLSFVEDIDEKLEQVLEDNDEVYDALDVKDISTLKKFIKAQMVPTTTVSLDEKGQEKMERLLERLDDLDDVSEVYHNWE